MNPSENLTEIDYAPVTFNQFKKLPKHTKAQITGIITKKFITQRNKHTAIVLQENKKEIIALILKKHPLKFNKKQLTKKKKIKINGAKIADDFIIIEQIKV